jgi:hypothetical protein
MQMQGQPAIGLGNGRADDFRELTSVMEVQNKEGGPGNTTPPPKESMESK